MVAKQLRLLLIPAYLLVWSALPADTRDRANDELVPIPEDERRQITLSLLERYPELASSPGIKAAYAPSERNDKDRLGATVIFYPHRESGGIKEAYQALCEWENLSQSWTCDAVQIRRYLNVANQDFEVRVRGDITSESAYALIDASRRDLQASLEDLSEVPGTAIMISPQADDGYLISWGTPEGYSRLTMLAQLRTGGDSANRDDWHATVLSTAEEWASDRLIGPPWDPAAPGLIEIVPYFAGGKFGGYRIGPGNDEKQFTSFGLKTGDLLTKVDGVDVSINHLLLARRFESLKDGETINVTIERGPKHIETEIGLKFSP